MPKKFNGPLAIPIGPRRITNYLNKDQVEVIIQGWVREDWEKLLLLCEEYKIATDDSMFRNLSLALARDFVPGFKEKKKRGQKSKWTPAHQGVLVVELELKKHDYNCSITKAAELLANQEPWMSFLKPRDKMEKSPLNPGEALRKQYNKTYKTGWGGLYRRRFVQLHESDQLHEWESMLSDLFSRE